MCLYRPRLLLGAAAVALKKGKLADASDYVGSASEFVEERSIAHMRPVVACVTGEVLSAEGRHEEAVDAFDSAVELATPRGFLPTIWKAHVGAAVAFRAMGRDSTSVERSGKATSAVDEIASMFADSDLGSRFVEKATLEISSRLEDVAIADTRQ